LRQVPREDQAVEVEEVYPLNKKLQNKHGGVVLIGGQLFGDTGDSGIPFCADLMTGELHWKKRGSGRGSAAIVAAEGHLYIWFSNAVLAMAKASQDGYEEVSTLEIEKDNDRPSWAHPVIAGSKLYLRMDDQILCYDLSAHGG
jgi:outer membrane protein assembly factor BamB